jgi:hypothetical protein
LEADIVTRVGILAALIPRDVVHQDLLLQKAPTSVEKLVEFFDDNYEPMEIIGQSTNQWSHVNRPYHPEHGLVKVVKQTAALLREAGPHQVVVKGEKRLAQDISTLLLCLSAKAVRDRVLMRTHVGLAFLGARQLKLKGGKESDTPDLVRGMKLSTNNSTYAKAFGRTPVTGFRSRMVKCFKRLGISFELTPAGVKKHKTTQRWFRRLWDVTSRTVWTCQGVLHCYSKKPPFSRFFQPCLIPKKRHLSNKSFFQCA